MNKIKVLEQNLINRIAAGEVVEKPSSVVKELVENSIDSGATQISIEIENGGTKKIIVIDNGCGMSGEDLKLSILPHTTSKINDINDLEKISTLGFRGEALASICSVSNVEIVSKTEKSETGTKIVVHGGKIENFVDVGAPNGTYIEVNNLFYNTPVRAKFLRKPKTEEVDITDYVERLILANPQISFKYIVEGKIVYNTQGTNLLDCIYIIYGKEIASKLIEIDFQKGEYKLNGYIGKPEIAKGNRNYQTLLIEKRFVKNFMISTSVQNGYGDFLMKGKFPFYVLKLSLPLDSVDVNIHPSKLEVKFEQPNLIYSLFNSAISNALLTSNQTKVINLINQNEETEKNKDNSNNINVKTSFEVEKKEKENDTQNNKQTLTKEEGISYNEKIDEGNEVIIKADLTEQNKENFKVTFSHSGLIDEVMRNSMMQLKKKDEIIKLENQNNEIIQFERNEKAIKNFSNEKGELQTILQKNKPLKQNEIKELNLIKNYKIVGTVLSTYVIIETIGNVYFIDQHAAHERILFDKFMQELKEQNPITQELLFPVILNVKDKEFNFLKDHIKLFEDFGFSINEFGHNTFKISSIPYIFSQLNITEFFLNVFAEVDNYIKQPIEYLKENIATKACKAAVKAGQFLDENEIEEILKLIGNGVLHCPHGRPFVLKLEQTQIEKWFKRLQ